MRKKLIINLCLFVFVFLCASVTVTAAPKTMPDGGLFDPEYYAETYPDVVAVLGNDESDLYNHYIQYGKTEGRNPVAPAKTVETIQASTPKCAEDMYLAVISKDVEALKKYARNASDYLEELKPFLWQERTYSKYYYIPCSTGNLTFVIYPADLNNGYVNVYIGVASQDAEVAQKREAKQRATVQRIYSSKYNYNQEMLDTNYPRTYGKDFFLHEDTFICYTMAPNGYKDYNVYADSEVIYGDAIRPADWYL